MAMLGGGQLMGGFSASKPKDDRVMEIMEEIKDAPEIVALGDVEVVSYSMQIVAGTNYTISLKHAAGTSEVKVFKPLPYTGKPASVVSMITSHAAASVAPPVPPSTLKLVYFPVRAKTEALRMIFAYYKVPYTYVSSSDYFGKPWPKAKQDTPFGQLPIMIMKNGQTIAQSGSLCRFAAELGDQSLIPRDAVDRAACDSIYEYGQDLSWLNPVVNMYRGDEFKSKMERFKQVWPGARANLIRALGSGPFMDGRKGPTYADFNCWHVVDLAQVLGGDIGELKTWYDRVRQLPGVREYLDARPDVTGVGTAPKLRPKS